MTVNDAVTPGTEAAVEPAGGASAEPATVTPEQFQELQRKHDETLKHISALEGHKQRADQLEAQNTQLQAMIAERMGQGAPPANPSPNQDQAEMQQFYAKVQQTAAFSQDPDARAAAKLWLAVIGGLQAVPGQIEQKVQLAPLPENDRTEVLKLQNELAAQGETISVATARKMLEWQRKATTPVPPPPPTPPPGTRVVPAPAPPVGSGPMSPEEYEQRYAAADTTEKRMELRRMRMNGGVRPR